MHNSKSPYISPEKSLELGNKTIANVKTAYGLITQDELRDIRGKAERREKKDASFISMQNLDEIKGRITIKSPEMRYKEKLDT